MKRFVSLSALLVALLPQSAFAWTDPLAAVKCFGLAGCGRAPANVLFTSTLPTLVVLLLQVASGLAVFFVVYAGFQLVFSMGDESKVTKARWGILYALGGLLLAMTAGTIVTIVSTEIYVPPGAAGVNLTLALISTAVRISMNIFNVALAMVIVIAGMRMVLAQGKSDEFNNGMKMLLYAVVGAVVVNLAKTLVLTFVTIGF